MRSNYLLILISIAMAILISGCSCQPKIVNNDSNDTSGNQTPFPGVNNEEFITGVAPVNDVQVLILESFPVQVNVEAMGYLPDGCTTIGNTTIRKDSNTFYVEISTIRPGMPSVRRHWCPSQSPCLLMCMVWRKVSTMWM